MSEQKVHGRNNSAESLASHASLHQTMVEYSSNYPAHEIGTAAELQQYLQSLPDDKAALRTEITKLREIAIQQHHIIKKLKLEVDIEHGRVKILRHDNEQLKKAAAQMYSEQEMQEENITNKLLKKIDGLKSEKSAIASHFEADSESISNNLMRQLKQLQKEKIELEQAMEVEQEFMVNRLTKQLDELRRNQRISPTASNASLNSTNPHPTASVTGGSGLPPLSPLMKPSPISLDPSHDDEMKRLRAKLNMMETEHEKKSQSYQTEIARLQEAINKSNKSK